MIVFKQKAVYPFIIIITTTRKNFHQNYIKCEISTICIFILVHHSGEEEATHEKTLFQITQLPSFVCAQVNKESLVLQLLPPPSLMCVEKNLFNGNKFVHTHRLWIYVTTRSIKEMEKEKKNFLLLLLIETERAFERKK